MLKKRRAQITIFLLIGVFMVSVFAIMYYLNNRMAQSSLEAPSQKFVVDLLKTGSIPYYVGLCLEENAEDGISLLGRQGGNIYMYQGGSAANPNFYYPLDTRISYGIQAPYLVNDTTYPEPPGYPGGEGHNKQSPVLDFRSWGRFGEVVLRKLCDSNGANSPFLFGNVISAPICLNDLYSDTLSSQWQLEEYVARFVPNCTNWTAIREETGYNVTPVGDVNITVRLGLSDVWVDAFIPLKIEVGGIEPVFAVGDFHKRLPVRLKRVVELASLLSMYDSYQLYFNLSKQYDYFSYYDSAMTVSVDSPLQSALGIYDDVVSIEDSRSVINGEDFVYRFARQNRYPVLDYIGMDHIAGNWSDFDFVVMENDTIVIDPNPFEDRENPDLPIDYIYDPDEDNLTYYYTGWKETCDDLFDFSLGRPVLNGCSEEEPSHPRIYYPDFPVGIDDYVTQFGAWSSSDPYLLTGRNASFTPGHDDIGPHNVTVWVCDPAGLCDYQVVRIMVLDYPQLLLNGSNMYDDIPDDRASVEDLYRLSADGTTAYYTPLLGYVFSDPIEPFDVVTNHPSKVVELPPVPPDFSRHIPFIYNYTFDRDNLCIGVPCVPVNLCTTIPCIHAINLSITSVSVPPYTFNLSVYQCLPHRSQDPLYKEMWPYNESNAFESSHLCCSLGNEVNRSFDYIAGTTETINSQVPNSFGANLKSFTIKYSDGTILCDMSKDLNGNFPVNIYCSSDLFYIYFNSTASDTLNITLRTSGKPSWGEYLPSSTVCHGGVPMIGNFQSFVQTDPIHPELGAPVIGNPADLVQGGINAARNDVFAITSERHCSGDRGNICSGDAVVGFTFVRSCPHFDTKWGESEHCTGAHKDVPQFLTATEDHCSIDDDCPGYLAGNGDERCYNNICFKAPDPSYFDCNPYGEAGALETYESYNDITTQSASPPSGYCNKHPTCSDDPWTFSFAEEGRFLLPNLTCQEGECKQSIVKGTDCSDFDGFVDSGDGYTNNVRYCKKEGDHLYTSKFSCNDGAPNDGIYTLENIGCNRALGHSALSTEKLCQSCYDSSNPEGGSSMTGKWLQSRNLCCGDDLGEGGFPYSTTTPNDQLKSVNGFSTDKMGEYSSPETVCDDMAKDSQGNWEEIDNDCNGNANCADNWCAPNDPGPFSNRGSYFHKFRLDLVNRKNHLGPKGSLCCSTGNACKNFLDPLGKPTGVDCNSSKECDCKAVGSFIDFHNNPPGNPYFTYSGSISSSGISPTIIRTCAATEDEVFRLLGVYKRDRHIKISGSSGQEYSVMISVSAVQGGDLCDRRVTLYVYDTDGNSVDDKLADPKDSEPIIAQAPFVVAFANVGSDDCLVDLKIHGVSTPNLPQVPFPQP